MKLLLPFVSYLATASAFVPPRQLHAATKSAFSLYSVLKPIGVDESIEDALDEGEGGVRLAKESAINICGSIEIDKDGEAATVPDNLIRYTKMTELPSVSNSAKVICFGSGKELYEDPGEGTTANVLYAPMEACKVALTKNVNMDVLNTVTDKSTVTINFLGGDDLIIGEVMDAGSELTQALGLKRGPNVKFNSIAFKQFPLEICSVTVVVTQEDASEKTGVDKSVGEGHVYMDSEGNSWTVLDDDINTAIE